MKGINIAFLISLINLWLQIHCLIYNQSVYRCTNGSQAFDITSVSVWSSQFAAIGTYSGVTRSIIVTSSNNASIDKADVVNVSGLSAAYKIRSIDSNNDTSSDTYILFSSSQIAVSVYKFQYNILLDIPPALLIQPSVLDATFGQTVYDVFVLAWQPGTLMLNTFYQLVYFRNGIQMEALSVAGATSAEFDRILYNKGKVFVSFNNMIKVYAGNSSLTLLSTISYTNTNLDQMDMTGDDTYFCYSNRNTIKIYYSSNLILKSTLTLPANIVSIQIAFPYIYATSLTKIYQVDLEIQELIDSSSFTVGGISYYIQYFGSLNNIVMSQAEGLTNTNLHLYGITNHYINASGSCYHTYGYDPVNEICIKNYVYIAPPPVDNSTNSTNATNTTNETYIDSTTNTTNTTNQIVVQLVPEPQVIIHPQPSSMAEEFINSLNTTAMAEATSFLGRTMTLASIRIYPTFLFSITGFMDDFWYYKYHRTEYPVSVKFFMQEVDIMNTLRLHPWFLDFIDWINTPLVCNQSNDYLYSFMNFNGTDPENVYFLHSAEDTYKSNLIMNILFLVAFRLVALALDKLRKVIIGCNRQLAFQQEFSADSEKNYREKDSKQLFYQNPNRLSFLRAVITSLTINSNWWLIFNATLQANMLKLTFDCCIQLLTPSNFSFQDKFNICMTVVFMFMLIFYCLCYYPLAYTFNDQDNSQILLAKSKYCFSSFYFECVYIVSRNFVRSFVHATFIQAYKLQICLLAVVDLFYFGIGLKMWRNFKNIFVAFFSILYSLFFFCFDLFFALQHNIFYQTIGTASQQNFSLVLVLILGASSILICFFLFIQEILDLYGDIREHCKKNKIENTFEQPKSKTNIGLIENEFNLKDINHLVEPSLTSSYPNSPKMTLKPILKIKSTNSLNQIFPKKEIQSISNKRNKNLSRFINKQNTVYKKQMEVHYDTKDEENNSSQFRIVSNKQVKPRKNEEDFNIREIKQKTLIYEQRQGIKLGQKSINFLSQVDISQSQNQDMAHMKKGLSFKTSKSINNQRKKRNF